LSFAPLASPATLRPPRTLLKVALLTAAALVVHGYHVGVEDQDVYLAAIKKSLDPALFPFNSTFFAEQMKAALFVPAVAATARVLHSVEWALLLWQLLSLFGILMGCRKLAEWCFPVERERWAAVLPVAVLFTLPLAGTALLLVDPYLNPRLPATAGILLALAAALDRRWLRAALWIVFAAAMHPLMAIFGLSLTVFCCWPQGVFPFRTPAALALFMLPLRLLHTPGDAWKEAVRARTYCYPAKWEWYEWLGLVAPLLLVWWYARLAERGSLPRVALLARRLLFFGLFQCAVALLMTLPAATEQLTAFQPMRWLHIFYFLFLMMTGGLAMHFLLRNRSAWWMLLVMVPLAAGMFVVQRDLYAHGDHIDLPGARPRNPWAQAFLWVRENTPKSAIFAIPPEYMRLPAEDAYGFRALAERSLLAENHKDPGEVMVFPDLADEWRRQVHAQRGMENFTLDQFAALRQAYGVSWVVLPATAHPPLACPYQNSAARVCRLE